MIDLLTKVQAVAWLLGRIPSEHLANAAALYLFFHNTKNGECHPSTRQLAKKAGTARSTTIAAFKRLVDMGMIEVEQSSGGRNQHNRYILKGPPDGPFNAETVRPTDQGGPSHGPQMVRTTDTHKSKELTQERIPMEDRGAVALFSDHAPRSRGSRLPESWRPSPDDVTYARELGMPEPMINREVEKFKNYWLAAAGSKGIKRDWSRTWKNWCINSIEFMAKDQKQRVAAATAMTEALQRRKASL